MNGYKDSEVNSTYRLILKKETIISYTLKLISSTHLTCKMPCYIC